MTFFSNVLTSVRKAERRSRISAGAVTYTFIIFLLTLNCGGNSSPKFKQYYRQGEQLYLTHCGNCHQKDGSGLGRVYPPLDTSDYMQQNFEAVICLIREGKEGSMIVNGKEYNQPMPGIPTLTDLEVAEIATYIYNTWTHERGIVEVKEVSAIMEQCASVE